MTSTSAQQAAARVDEALAAFAGSGALERAEDLVRTLMDYYGSALSRLIDVLSETPDGAASLRRAAADPVVGGLLVLHDVHPVSMPERVADALEQVRPYLGSHAGDVELVDVSSDGVVRLRLKGACDGCPASSATVTDAIQRAIEEAAPEVTRIDVEGMAPARGPGGRTLLPVLGAVR